MAVTADAPLVTEGEPSLAEQVASRRWYHTIRLSDEVTSPGWMDTEKAAPSMPWPGDLTGKRCLDVGTFDGAWAFEMERRGAGEVLAIDILDEGRWDWPPIVDPASRAGIDAQKGQGRGFAIAKRALGSNVERRDASIYDLNPEEFGTFDLVFVGSLLLHLRDPILALSRVATVTDGSLIVSDALSARTTLTSPLSPTFDLDGVGRPYWWKPNLAGLRHMVKISGFRPVTRCEPFLMPPGPGHPRPPLSQAVRSRTGWELIRSSRLGDPHARIRAVRTSEP